MFTKKRQLSITEENLSTEKSKNKVSFYQHYIISTDINDTLSNIGDDEDKLKIVIKREKKKSPNKIGKRGFMIDNINKKLKGNFFKYISKVFKIFGFKVKKLPQSFVTNVSIKMNKPFLQKPLILVFDHYGITIPEELSLNLTSKYLDINENQGVTQTEIFNINMKTDENKPRSEDMLLSIQNSDNVSSEISYLKKIINEYSFEYVFDNIFLKSEYFSKLIEEFKNDPRYTPDYIDKLLNQAKQCMKKLKG